MRRIFSLAFALLLALTPCLALAEPTADGVELLTDFVRRAFDDVPDINYEYDEEMDSFTLLFGSSNEFMGDIYAFVDVYDDGLRLVACYETDAPQDRIDEIVRFINMFNADILSGKYYIDLDSGSIFYDDYVDFGMVDLGALDEEMQMVFHGYFSSFLNKADYDAEYFEAIIFGETAENAYAMHLADAGY